MRATTLAAGGLACAGAAMTIAAFAAGGETHATTASAAPARDGLAVWIAQGCGSCHTFAPAGSTAPIGPDLQLALQGNDAAYIEGKILAPSRGTMMPEDFATRISPPDLDLLVTFIAQGVAAAIGRVIDHVGIRVSDRAASERFYDTVLSVLEVERTSADSYTEWGDFALGTDGPVTQNLHVAFYAPTHDLVEAFYRAGVEAGYTDDGAPGPRPQYREDYYGAFLRDPDGNSVEAVYLNETRDTGAIDHVWLRTRDVAAIRAFYVAAGHELGIDKPEHVQIPIGEVSISYVAGEPLTEHVHIAFAAPTNAAVDEWHAKAIAAGYKDNGAPGERAVYHAGYYGAFVLDPDGHNIEAVNHNR